LIVPTKTTEEEKQVGEELVTKVEEQPEQGGEVVGTHSKQTSVASRPEEELKVGNKKGHSPTKQTNEREHWRKAQSTVGS